MRLSKVKSLFGEIPIDSPHYRESSIDEEPHFSSEASKAPDFTSGWRMDRYTVNNDWHGPVGSKDFFPEISIFNQALINRGCGAGCGYEDLGHKIRGHENYYSNEITWILFE
jgi:hypothetical protein